MRPEQSCGNSTKSRTRKVSSLLTAGALLVLSATAVTFLGANLAVMAAGTDNPLTFDAPALTLDQAKAPAKLAATAGDREVVLNDWSYTFVTRTLNNPSPLNTVQEVNAYLLTHSTLPAMTQTQINQIIAAYEAEGQRPPHQVSPVM